MKMSNLGRSSSRHPAVIDLLGAAPTTKVPPGTTTNVVPGGAPTRQLTAPAATAPPTGPGRMSGLGGRRPGKKTMAVVGAVGVVLAGAVVIGQLGGDDTAPAQAEETSDFGPTDENGLPTLNLPESEKADPAGETEQGTPPLGGGEECRAERGDQRSGDGVIAAWNHAYYTQRSGAAARALATPNSSVVPADQLQGFIDAVPVGTTYCLSTKALTEDIYLMDLSELRPGGAQRITQTVTTKKIDGKWFVDVFN